MTAEYRFREPRPEDVLRLAQTMRPIDKAECYDLGSTPRASLERMFSEHRAGLAYMLCLVEVTQQPNGNFSERLLGIFGAHKNFASIGSLWADGLTFSDHKFIRKWVNEWMRVCMQKVGLSEAGNYVRTDNYVAIKWIKLISGSHVDKSYEYTFNGNPYYKFTVTLDV